MIDITNLCMTMLFDVDKVLASEVTISDVLASSDGMKMKMKAVYCVLIRMYNRRI
jgi:hypothetical protein